MAAITDYGAGYSPFWIQREGEATAKDSLAEWGMAVKSFPFRALPDPKEPYSTDWHDEDGTDEYTAEMHYSSYDIEVQFLMLADTAEDIVANLRSFFEYVRTGEFMVFDAYTRIGRRGVRYNGYSEDAMKSRDGRAYLIFTAGFRVNDPVTFIHKNGDTLEERT